MAMNDEMISPIQIDEDSTISSAVKVNLDPNNHAYLKHKRLIINADINKSPTSKQKITAWQCAQCTLENMPNTQQCAVCLAPRPYTSDDDSDDDTYTLQPKTEQKHEAIDNDNIHIHRYQHHPKIVSTKISRPKVISTNKRISIHKLHAFPTPVDTEQNHSTYTNHANNNQTLSVSDINGDINGSNDIILSDDDIDGHISFEPGPGNLGHHLSDDDDDDNDDLEFFNTSSMIHRHHHLPSRRHISSRHHPMIYSMYGGGDYFVCDILEQLDLERYSDTFKEFNIDQKSLIFLDEAVVEFLIPDIKEQENFIKWLKRYKRMNSNDIIQFDLDELKLLEDNMKFGVFGFIRECEVMIPYYIPELIRWLILHYYHFMGVHDLNKECLYWTDLKKKKQRKLILPKTHYFNKPIKISLSTEKIKSNVSDDDILLFDE